MSETSCPHYTAHIAGQTGVCRGCGAIVSNPASVTAQQTGLVTGATGAVTKLSEPAANVTLNPRPERTRNR